MTWPMNTSSTRSGAIPARSTAARMAVAPRSVAGTVERPPPNLPMGVRAADRMKASLMGEMVLRLAGGPAVLLLLFLPQLRWELAFPLREEARQESHPARALEDREALQPGLDLTLDQFLDRLLRHQLLRRHPGDLVP